jgi:hypothetical protein
VRHEVKGQDAKGGARRGEGRCETRRRKVHTVGVDAEAVHRTIFSGGYPPLRQHTWSEAMAGLYWQTDGMGKAMMVAAYQSGDGCCVPEQ